MQQGSLQLFKMTTERFERLRAAAAGGGGGFASRDAATPVPVELVEGEGLVEDEDVLHVLDVVIWILSLAFSLTFKCFTTTSRSFAFMGLP